MKTVQMSQDEITARLSVIFPTATYCGPTGASWERNLPLDLHTVVTKGQLSALKEMGWKLDQIEAIVNQSGMKDHLHIWVSKIEPWDEV